MFYPRGLQHRAELAYVSRRLNSVEINGTFYSLQCPASFIQWYEQTPPDFLFAVKGGRFITHMKRLNEVETPLANFFASGPLALREKLGPILWQFPPQFRFDLDRFERFLALLPADTDAAACLARRHDARMERKGVWLDGGASRPIRYAVEVRHESFFAPAFIDLLRRWRVALAFADTAGHWPYAEDLTADFVYVRLHGSRELYASGYSDAELDWWATRLRTWMDGREPDDARHVSDDPPPAAAVRCAYVYFDNDARAHAPFDAVNLARRFSIPSTMEGTP